MIPKYKTAPATGAPNPRLNHKRNPAMKRRDFVTATTTGLAFGMVSNTRAAEHTPPNLLIFQTDEHNFRTLGCYRKTLSKEQALMWGDAVVETPHIDWLAENGALCTRFYATAPGWANTPKTPPSTPTTSPYMTA